MTKIKKSYKWSLVTFNMYSQFWIPEILVSTFERSKFWIVPVVVQLTVDLGKRKNKK